MIRFWAGLFAAAAIGMLTPVVHAQQLDLDEIKQRKHGVKPSAASAKPKVSPQAGEYDPLAEFIANPDAAKERKPISVTVSKTLYLPPAMYGQWSLVGTLMQTNAPGDFRPMVNDIWILARVGNQIMITNPANGASAAIHVDQVEGDRATFHRVGPAGRNKLYQETPTISVNGDIMTGQMLNQIRYLKDGKVTHEYFALYRIEAQRISGASVRFKPEAEAGPDIVIEDVQRR